MQGICTSSRSGRCAWDLGGWWGHGTYESVMLYSSLHAAASLPYAPSSAAGVANDVQ